eukprot:COSAG02_NODE_3529_length_6610_cov_40.548610_1_plen_65_part_00
MQVSEFFEPIGMFHRNFPWAHTCLKRFPSKHTDRLQSPVPNSICPGWMLRAGPRAAARARTSGI